MPTIRCARFIPFFQVKVTNLLVLRTDDSGHILVPFTRVEQVAAEKEMSAVISVGP